MPKKYVSVAKSLLQHLLVDFDLFLDILEDPYAFRREYRYGRMPRRKWDKICRTRKEKEALAKFKRKRWIEIQTKGNEVIAKIHSDAAVSMLRDLVKNIHRTIPNGETCLVLFDFPEAARAARDSWRFLLKQSGFRQKQLSVWVSSKDVAKELLALTHLLHIDRWVVVYKGKEME